MPILYKESIKVYGNVISNQTGFLFGNKTIKSLFYTFSVQEHIVIYSRNKLKSTQTHTLINHILAFE